MTKSPYLDGQLLIAMPGIGDTRFERAVIFVCATAMSVVSRPNFFFHKKKLDAFACRIFYF